jgi:diguanylate cyclase (GGDEF)-like protein
MDLQRWVIAFTVPMALATTFALGIPFTSPYSSVFLTGALVYTVASFIITLRHRRALAVPDQFRLQRLKNWETLHSFLMAAFGLVWAIPTWMPVDDAPISPLMFSLLASGMALGISAPRKSGFFAFLSSLLFIGGLGLAQTNQEMRILPAVLLFGFVMTLMAAMIADAFSESSMLRHRHESLSKALVARNDWLERGSNHDQLTGLPNRHMTLHILDRFVTRSLADEAQLAALFIDLDRFKVINDSLGHNAGDAALIEISRRLEQAVRPGDVVGRLTGDEFVAILPDIPNARAAMDVAARILRSIERPMQLSGREVRVGACIGISLSAPRLERANPDTAAYAGELLRQADAAMYRAKLAGRNRVELFDEMLSHEVAELTAMESTLLRAMKLGQIEAWYQPEVELATGRVVGVEALARWNHPERGLLEAKDFLQAAEGGTAVDDFARYMLARICTDRMRWEAEALIPEGLRVRVNLSKHHLIRAGGLDYFGEVLNSTTCPPKWLSVDLAESDLGVNPTEAVGQLKTLYGNGVHLVLDRFGVGPSSLALFRAMPLAAVKIDHSLVQGIDQNEAHAQVVRSIAMTAREFGVPTVALGVGTNAELITVTSIGCDRGQGHAVVRPMREPELLAFIEARVLLNGR